MSPNQEADQSLLRLTVPASEINPELARDVQALQDLIRTERRNGFRAAADVFAQCGEFFDADEQIDSAVEIYLDDSKRMDDAKAPTPASSSALHGRVLALLNTWKKRASLAFPRDAMLINRHVRELSEAMHGEAKS